MSSRSHVGPPSISLRDATGLRLNQIKTERHGDHQSGKEASCEGCAAGSGRGGEEAEGRASGGQGSCAYRRWRAFLCRGCEASRHSEAKESAPENASKLLSARRDNSTVLLRVGTPLRTEDPKCSSNPVEKPTASSSANGTAPASQSAVQLRRKSRPPLRRPLARPVCRPSPSSRPSCPSRCLRRSAAVQPEEKNAWRLYAYGP